MTANTQVRPSILNPIINQCRDPMFPFTKLGTASHVAGCWGATFETTTRSLENKAAEVIKHANSGDRVATGKAVTSFQKEVAVFRKNQATAETDLDKILDHIDLAEKVLRPHIRSEVDPVQQQIDKVCKAASHLEGRVQDVIKNINSGRVFSPITTSTSDAELQAHVQRHSNLGLAITPSSSSN